MSKRSRARRSQSRGETSQSTGKGSAEVVKDSVDTAEVLIGEIYNDVVRSQGFDPLAEKEQRLQN